eukprot:TRINITY_DN37033_c0_g1_i1.p1 TRINITY_DN37033_c0_g1~~TRINITY_DN37033_c0_g1_i1.p1  ORF type:complete len:416 (+),score=42.87 TRINITY_DN37033_c0_g1_i1:20-1267(+)
MSNVIKVIACILAYGTGTLLSFQDWMVANEIQTHSVQLQWAKKSGWGWFAANDIVNETEILTIPLRSMMWANTNTLESFKSQLSAETYQTASMIYTLLSVSDQFQAFAELLRNSTPSKLPLLQAENRLDCMCEELTDFRATISEELSAIKTIFSQIQEFSEDDIEWAYRVVLERAFTYDDETVLIPAGDSLNQRMRNPSASWTITSEGMKVKTCSFVKEGEEVRINYRSGVSSIDTFKKYGYKGRGTGKVYIPLGLPLEGRQEFIQRLEETVCIQGQLFVDSNLGIASDALLKCSAVAILPNRPEAELFLQEDSKLPKPMDLTISIGSYQHIIRMIDAVVPRYKVPTQCQDDHTNFTKDGEAAAAYVIKELKQAKKSLEIRTASLMQEWDLLTETESGRIWKNHQIHISTSDEEL